MSPIKKEFILYLEDMFQSMQRIEEYLGDLDFKEFKKTFIVVDAVIRNFEIIGEALKKIPISIQEKYPGNSLEKNVWTQEFNFPRIF